MKKYIIILALMAFTTIASAQIKIPGTRYSFQFPTDEWKFLQTTNVDKNCSVYLYSFNGRYVVDNAGDTTLPFMCIYVRKHYDGSVYDIAYQRFQQHPYQSLDEYPFGDGGIGYLAAYTDRKDNKDYEFRMVYIKDRSTIIEVRLETTVDNFEEFDEMFQSIINSLSVK